MSSSPTYDYSDKLSFLAEWFDYESAYHKKFLLNYYPVDNTIEIFDRELNRIFLKRLAYEGLQAKDMFVGNTVRVYGRQIKITDYADCKTRDFVGKARQSTFAIIKPKVVHRMGEIFNQIQDRGFEVVKARMCRLKQDEALELYDFLKGDAFLPFVMENIMLGPIIALELVGEDAIQRWKNNIGPMDPQEARKSAPDTLRAIYGHEIASNGFHGAVNCEQAAREAAIFFPPENSLSGGSRKPPESNVQFKNSTCCVIKPHALQEGKLGDIISFITSSKFKITAMQSFYLSSVSAEEFLEVYKGVISDFHALLMSFLDGLCIALEISAKNEDVEDVHEEFRKLCGPSDSDVARQIRPNTLRAKFGNDKYRNAVHCTDLKGDTVLDLEYLFKILS